MSKACRVKYIDENYKDFPDLRDRLTDIYHNIWRQITDSKLFRQYGNDPATATYLFSSRKTLQNKKQRDFITKLNEIFNAPKGTSVVVAKATKAGNNFKAVVNVHPVAQQEYDKLQQTKSRVQGTLFEVEKVMPISEVTDEEISEIYRDKADYLKVQNLPVIPYYVFKSKARKLEDALKKIDGSTKETILEALKCL
jgi:hypothetical protein